MSGGMEEERVTQSRSVEAPNVVTVSPPQALANLMSQAHKGAVKKNSGRGRGKTDGRWTTRGTRVGRGGAARKCGRGRVSREGWMDVEGAAELGGMVSGENGVSGGGVDSGVCDAARQSGEVQSREEVPAS